MSEERRISESYQFQMEKNIKFLHNMNERCTFHEVLYLIGNIVGSPIFVCLFQSLSSTKTDWGARKSRYLEMHLVQM